MRVDCSKSSAHAVSALQWQAASLWEAENADDAYSELNRVVPGMNGGWFQIAGPLSRMTEAGDPLISGYTTSSMDVSALLAANVGNTLRLRFAETDNVFTFQRWV